MIQRWIKFLKILARIARGIGIAIILTDIATIGKTITIISEVSKDINKCLAVSY